MFAFILSIHLHILSHFILRVSLLFKRDEMNFYKLLFWDLLKHMVFCEKVEAVFIFFPKFCTSLILPPLKNSLVKYIFFSIIMVYFLTHRHTCLSDYGHLKDIINDCPNTIDAAMFV